jgi:hypothetical protein
MDLMPFALLVPRLWLLWLWQGYTNAGALFWKINWSYKKIDPAIFDRAGIAVSRFASYVFLYIAFLSSP